MSDGTRRRQNRPYPMALDAGTYTWCQCGRSAKDPFCEGSHAGTGITPRVFVLHEAAKVELCGCKMNQGGDAFCDGSHDRL